MTIFFNFFFKETKLLNFFLYLFISLFANPLFWMTHTHILGIENIKLLTLRHAHVSGQIFYKFNCDLNVFLYLARDLSLQLPSPNIVSYRFMKKTH